MTPALRGFRAAIVFLTRVPVGGFPYTREEWRWSSGWFPWVGALLGAAAAGTFLITRGLGPEAASLAALGATLMLTGAFHEDGLADTADALGGAYEPKGVLRILKDSRIGTFGTVALLVVLGAKVALVARLDAAAPLALVYAHVLARVTPVWQLALLPYVTDDAASKSRRVTRGGLPQAALASAAGVLMLAGAAVCGVPIGRLSATVLLLAGLGAVTAWRYRKRTGGVTGDFLGATEQLGEVVALGALAWV